MYQLKTIDTDVLSTININVASINHTIVTSHQQAVAFRPFRPFRRQDPRAVHFQTGETEKKGVVDPRQNMFRAAQL